jgi:hypothetical protein
MIETHLGLHREELKREIHGTPCTFLVEHRSTMYWVLGVVSGLAMLLGGYLWAQSERAATRADAAAVAVEKMGVKLDYLSDTMREVRSDVRSLVSANRQLQINP